LGKGKNGDFRMGTSLQALSAQGWIKENFKATFFFLIHFDIRFSRLVHFISFFSTIDIH